MRLTKYTHARVRLRDGDRQFVIDPGIWSEGAALEGVSQVLINTYPPSSKTRGLGRSTVEAVG